MSKKPFAEMLEHYRNERGFILADIGFVFGADRSLGNNWLTGRYFPTDRTHLEAIDFLLQTNEKYNFVSFADGEVTRPKIVSERMSAFEKSKNVAFPDAVYLWREARNFSQKTLASKTNIPVEAVRKIEEGSLTASSEQAASIVNALNILPGLKLAYRKNLSSSPRQPSPVATLKQIIDALENSESSGVEPVPEVDTSYLHGCSGQNFGEVFSKLLERTGSIAADVEKVVGAGKTTVVNWTRGEFLGSIDRVTTDIFDELFCIPGSASLARFAHPPQSKYAQFSESRAEAYRSFLQKPLRDALWYWREEKNYLMSTLAQKSGVDADKIRDFERGVAIPTQDELGSIMSALKILPGLQRNYRSQLAVLQHQNKTPSVADLYARLGSELGVSGGSQQGPQDVASEFSSAYQRIRTLVRAVCEAPRSVRDSIRAKYGTNELSELSGLLFALRNDEQARKAAEQMGWKLG